MRGASPPESRRRQRGDSDDRRRRDDRPILARYNSPPEPTTTTRNTPHTASSSSSNASRTPRVRFSPPMDARHLSQLGSKTGFLRKQADNEPGKWTKYFFVLKPTTYLYYYNSPEDAEPRGIIDMEFIRDIRYNSECQQRGVGGSANCFRLTGVLPPEFGGNKGSQKTKFRPLYLDSGSRDDARAWMDAVKGHRFDPQREKDQETLLKTMVVVDKRAEKLGDQAKQVDALAQTVLQKGELYVSKARGTALPPVNRTRRRGHTIDEGEESMEALRRVAVLLDELFAECERQQEQNKVLETREAELKLEVEAAKHRETDDYERKKEVLAYQREIERLNLELQHQEQVAALKQRVAIDSEREQEVVIYRRKIEKLQLELEKQAEDRDRVIDQYELRAIDLVEREQAIESRENAVAKRLDAVERDYYQRMREINRDAQRRAKEQSQEFVQYQYELLDTLKQLAHDPVRFEQFVDDAAEKVSDDARLRGAADVFSATYSKMESRTNGSKLGLFQTPGLSRKRGNSNGAHDDYRLGKLPSSPSSVADTYDTERTSSNSFTENGSTEESSAAAEMRRRLPKSWIYQESRVHPGLYFYFNTKTGEMRWTHPMEVETSGARGNRAQTIDSERVSTRPARRSTMPLNRHESKARTGPSGMFEMTTMNEIDEQNDRDSVDEPTTEEKAKRGRSWRPALPKFRGKAKVSSGEDTGEKYSLMSFIGGPPGANSTKGSWLGKKLPKTPFSKRTVSSPVPESPVGEEHPFEEHEDGSIVF